MKCIYRTHLKYKKKSIFFHITTEKRNFAPRISFNV